MASSRIVSAVIAAVILLPNAACAAQKKPKPHVPTIKELQVQVDALSQQNELLSVRLRIVQAQRNQALDADAVDGASAIIASQPKRGK